MLDIATVVSSVNVGMFDEEDFHIYLTACQNLLLPPKDTFLRYSLFDLRISIITSFFNFLYL